MRYRIACKITTRPHVLLIVTVSPEARPIGGCCASSRRPDLDPSSRARLVELVRGRRKQRRLPIL
jgi:hypothetical protein